MTHEKPILFLALLFSCARVLVDDFCGNPELKTFLANVNADGGVNEQYVHMTRV